MTLSELLNAPTEITMDGVVYKLRQPTLLEQATFERWLEQRAREAAARSVDLPDEDRRQLLRDVNADIAAGVYSFGGPACVTSLGTPAGLVKLISIILACPEATAQKLVDKQLEEIVACILAGGDHDPKLMAAVLAKVGLPPDFLSRSSPTPPSTTPSPTSRDSAPSS
jgi:hypothetical protein